MLKLNIYPTLHPKMGKNKWQNLHMQKVTITKESKENKEEFSKQMENFKIKKKLKHTK